MIRTAWGNQASAVTVEQVEAVREKYSLEQPLDAETQGYHESGCASHLCR